MSAKMDQQLHSAIIRPPGSQTPIPVGVCAGVLVGFLWALKDFHDWTSFGTAGTLPTWLGYLKTSSLRIRHIFSNNDLFDTSSLSTKGPSYLPKDGLPPRRGGRPRIRPRILPPRYRPRTIDLVTRENLQNLVHRLAHERPDLVETKPSHPTGKTKDGFYVLHDLATLSHAAHDKILDHEIARAHATDNSLHVLLSDRDARKVIEAGWGQRFPSTAVPSGYVMVYAPRDESEMEVSEKIVRASATWITGVDFSNPS